MARVASSTVVLLAIATIVAVGARPSTSTKARPKPSPTWQAVASTPGPAFVVKRHIVVTTESGFWAAWSRVAPGDVIDVRGVHFTGETTFTNVSPPGWAEVRFLAGTTFSGVSGGDLPAVWIKQVSHVYFVGGSISNPRGSAGILVYDSSSLAWRGFVIRNTGGSGLMVQGITRVNDHLDLEGDISHWGLDLSLDPHAEKGTGLHGALLADAYFGVENSRFVLTLHDGATGAGVEAGGARSTDVFRHNVLDLRCSHLTMRAETQVAGNCLELWGQNVTANVVGYLSADHLQGRAYDVNGMDAGQSLHSNTVSFGRAAATNLNPDLGRTESAVSAGNPFDPRFGTVFRNVRAGGA
jgi:hypothetical protein